MFKQNTAGSNSTVVAKGTISKQSSLDFPFPDEEKEAKMSKKSSDKEVKISKKSSPNFDGPVEDFTVSLFAKQKLNLPIIHEHSEKNVSNQSVISSDERSDFTIEKEAQALND